MHIATMCPKQTHAVRGVLHEMRCGYQGLSQLSDMRKAREKLSRFETVLMIIAMRNFVGMVRRYLATHNSKAIHY